MHSGLVESFVKVVTQHVEVVTVWSCCIHLCSRNYCFRDILFSPLFCRKVASIKVDVICELLPPSFRCCPPTLLSFPVILLWWTKWAFSLADKQRWAWELLHCDMGKKQQRKHKRNAMLNVLLDVSWSTVPSWCSRNVKRGSLYCWTSKVYLLIRKEEKQTKKLIYVFLFFKTGM